MMSKMLCWFTLFSVLFNAQQLVVAIDLARLYGHDGHESSIQKRSGNYLLTFIIFFLYLYHRDVQILAV